MMYQRIHTTDDLGELVSLAKQETGVARADAMKALKERLGRNADVADLVGCSPQCVEQLLLLADAPEGVRAFVEQGRVTASLAVNVVRQANRNKTSPEHFLLKAVEKAQRAGRDRIRPKDIQATCMSKAANSLHHVYLRLGRFLSSQRGHSLNIEISRADAEQIYTLIKNHK